jgi:hypothetical protein
MQLILLQIIQQQQQADMVQIVVFKLKKHNK